MRKNGITFSELRELLLELGFCELPQAPNRIRFEHPMTGTVLLFRAHESKDRMTEREMLVVRRQLVDNGLIEGSAFDRFLQRASA
jgi:hypothetical protein